MTQPRRTLENIAALAAQLAHQWDTYRATVAALTAPLIGTSTGPRGHGGHADPTATHVLARTHHDDTLEAIDAWHAQGAWIARRVLGTLAAEGPHAAPDHAARRAALCADPLCTDYAAKAGLCVRHYTAAYRQRQREAQKPAATAPPHPESHPHSPTRPQPPHQEIVDTATKTGLEPGTLATRAPDSTTAIAECVGTCTRCGTRIHGLHPAHVQALLDAHHTECPART